MSSGTPVSVFISYSREDSSFVDRLEADLQARTFHTWVDRRRLEGGQDWLDKIQDAIEQCDVLLVVLSPPAVASEYVRMEYRQARLEKKLVIPLDYKACEKVPMDLNHIQWVNFRGEYEQGLNEILISLSNVAVKTLTAPTSSSKTPASSTDKELAAPNASSQTLPSPTDEEVELVAPQPALPQAAPDLDDLYRAGVVAKSKGDLERAYVLWQQILDREPHFRNDTLAPWIDALSIELPPIRKKRLRERALQAHRRGEWGQAIGAWEALLGLEPENGEATKGLEIAKHNQKFAYLYESAEKFVTEGDYLAAKTQLDMLLHDAPDYGDPRRLKPKINQDPALANQIHEPEVKVSTASVIFLLCLLIGAGISVLVLLMGSQLMPATTARELATWLPFETLYAIGLSMLVIIPGIRNKLVIYVKKTYKEKKFSNTMKYMLWAVAASYGLIVIIASTGAIWAGISNVQFGWDFSLIGIPISLLNGVGLTGILLVCWNAIPKLL